MATLPYVGATQVNPNDLTTLGYLNSLAASSLSQATVNSLLATGFSGYVLKSYVDAQDALNATQAFVDAGDATRLHLSQLGAINGIAGLDNGGRVEVARVPVASTQRWPSPFISPSSYHATSITTSTAEAQLYTVSVADPGYTYKLLIHGLVDASSSVDGQYSLVRVRQGSSTGQIVGAGGGVSEEYIIGSQPVSFTTPGAVTYTVPTGFTNFDIVVLGGGGSGGNSSANGGSPGIYSSATLIAGSTLPTGTLTVTPGTGGAAGSHAGSASTVTGAGVTTITGAGGSAGSAPGTAGTSPGDFTLNGQRYIGGLAQTNAGRPGNSPGGGGHATGQTAGGDGAVWITPYNSLTYPTGPVKIFPQSFDQQTSVTGATTLFVMLVSSGIYNVTATTLRPKLHVVPIPA